MKPLAQRNPAIVGAVGMATIAGLVVAALQYDRLPFFDHTNEHSAYFAEAGGLHSGAPVQVSGFRVGEVSEIRLDGPKVLIRFKVDERIRLGDRTEAAIETKSLLGAKLLNVTPRGDGVLSDAIPLDRTKSPYQLPDALGDLASTVRTLNTDDLSESLATLSQTFKHTPTDLRLAVDGVTRLSQTIDNRDSQLRQLLTNAAKSTTVLAERSDTVARLISDTNALMAQLRAESTALDGISHHISVLSRQLSQFVADNHVALRPSLDKLNGVLTILDNRKERVQKALNMFDTYVMSFGESLASGPFFKAYVANLLPGQFVQPFIDAAFSDLGLDPHVLPPSALTDPQTGQPATPALPMPYPRTGQGGEPNLTLPDAITGNPGDPRYPYREPPPAPPPGGPPPGPPAPSTPAAIAPTSGAIQ